MYQIILLLVVPTLLQAAALMLWLKRRPQFCLYPPAKAAATQIMVQAAAAFIAFWATGLALGDLVLLKAIGLQGETAVGVALLAVYLAAVLAAVAAGSWWLLYRATRALAVWRQTRQYRCLLIPLALAALPFVWMSAAILLLPDP